MVGQIGFLLSINNTTIVVFGGGQPRRRYETVLKYRRGQIPIEEILFSQSKFKFYIPFRDYHSQEKSKDSSDASSDSDHDPEKDSNEVGFI